MRPVDNNVRKEKKRKWRLETIWGKKKKKWRRWRLSLFFLVGCIFILYDSLLLFHKGIFLPPVHHQILTTSNYIGHRAIWPKTFFFSFVLNFLFCVFLWTVRVENHLGTTCQTFCSSRQFSPIGADKRIDAQGNVYRTVYRHLFSDWGRWKEFIYFFNFLLFLGEFKKRRRPPSLPSEMDF
jgi:hypothetical protein